MKNIFTNLSYTYMKSYFFVDKRGKRIELNHLLKNSKGELFKVIKHSEKFYLQRVEISNLHIPHENNLFYIKEFDILPLTKNNSIFYTIVGKLGGKNENIFK